MMTAARLRPTTATTGGMTAGIRGGVETTTGGGMTVARTTVATGAGVRMTLIAGRVRMITTAGPGRRIAVTAMMTAAGGEMIAKRTAVSAVATIVAGAVKTAIDDPDYGRPCALPHLGSLLDSAPTHLLVQTN